MDPLTDDSRWTLTPRGWGAAMEMTDEEMRALRFTPVSELLKDELEDANLTITVDWSHYLDGRMV